MTDLAKSRMTMVTVNYNYGAYLEQCLQSVITQPDFGRVDYVVMDAGSTDNSVDIIKGLSQHFTYWQSEPDKGNYDGVARGFEKSDAPYMGWLNSDDMLVPWALRTVMDIFDQLPEVRWITSRFPLIARADGTVINSEIMPGVDEWGFFNAEHVKSLELPSSGWITQDATFWRRDLWDEVGGDFDYSLELACDFELWARFIQKTPLYSVPVPLGIYRTQGENKAMVHRDQYRDECVKVLSRHTPLIPEDIDRLTHRVIGKKLRISKLHSLLPMLKHNDAPPLKTVRYSTIDQRYVIVEE